MEWNKIYNSTDISWGQENIKFLLSSQYREAIQLHFMYSGLIVLKKQHNLNMTNWFSFMENLAQEIHHIIITEINEKWCIRPPWNWYMVIKYMTVTWSNITIYFVSHLNISKSCVYQNVVYVSNEIIAKLDESI